MFSLAALFDRFCVTFARWHDRWTS